MATSYPHYPRSTPQNTLKRWEALRTTWTRRSATTVATGKSNQKTQPPPKLTNWRRSTGTHLPHDWRSLLFLKYVSIQTKKPLNTKLPLSQHIVFALTGVMSYVIPDVPSAVKTQMQRERQLAKEARYERGLKSSGDDDLLRAIKDKNQQKVDHILRRGSWTRRTSRHSDALEAHVDISAQNHRKISDSTLWEVTWKCFKRQFPGKTRRVGNW